MRSSGSPSPGSTENEPLAPPDPLRMAGSDRTRTRRQRFGPEVWRQRRIAPTNWPVLYLIPVLVAIFQAAAITPLLHLIFGESFGLTGGRDAPWPGGVAVLGLAGFYVTILLGRFVQRDRLAQLLAFIAWLTVSLAWLATVPDYDVSGLIGDPWSLVTDHGYMVGPLFLAMGCWWQGMRYAADESLIQADELRAMGQRGWGLLLGGVVFAALMGNRSADAALDATRWAVPIAAIASMALIAAGETESTRQIARSRGAAGPKWSRWLRISGLVTAIAGVVSLVFIVLLGPDALQFLVTATGQLLRWFGIGVGYALYGIFYLLYQVIRAVYYLLELIFGDISISPMEAPEQPREQGDQFLPREQGEQEPWEQAELIRWIALGIAILIVAIILFRIRRRAVNRPDTDALDESRDSVFSTGLLRNQLRDLFRRKPKESGPRELDLQQEPGSVREVFLYLSVLANRQQVPRREEETPDDFARRLRALWPGTAEPLIQLTRGYEAIRYGDREDAPTNPELGRARAAWRSIYDRRKDWQPPEEDE